MLKKRTRPEEELGIECTIAECIVPVDATADNRSSEIIHRTSSRMYLGTANPTVWRRLLRSWPTIFAPILISFSFRSVGEDCFIVSAVAYTLRELP